MSLNSEGSEFQSLAAAYLNVDYMSHGGFNCLKVKWTLNLNLNVSFNWIGQSLLFTNLKIQMNLKKRPLKKC